MMPRYIDAEKMPNDKFWEDLTDKEKAKILAYLLSSPTADVEEVRHGEWIPLENDEFQCSECGNRVASSNPSIDVTRDLHYCWNCGVKMNGNKAKNGE